VTVLAAQLRLVGTAHGRLCQHGHAVPCAFAHPTTSCRAD